MKRPLLVLMIVLISATSATVGIYAYFVVDLLPTAVEDKLDVFVDYDVEFDLLLLEKVSVSNATLSIVLISQIVSTSIDTVQICSMDRDWCGSRHSRVIRLWMGDELTLSFRFREISVMKDELMILFIDTSWGPIELLFEVPENVLRDPLVDPIPNYHINRAPQRSACRSHTQRPYQTGRDLIHVKAEVTCE